MIFLIGLVGFLSFPSPAFAYIESGSAQLFPVLLVIFLLSLALFYFKLKPKPSYLSILLLSLAPPLYLYSLNQSQVAIKTLLLSLIISVLLSCLAAFLVKLMIRDKLKALSISLLGLTLFYLYGHLFDLTKGLSLGKIIIGTNTNLLICFLIFLSINSTLILKNTIKPKTVASFLTLFSIAVLLAAMLNLGHLRLKQASKPSSDFSTNQNLPDIYYIIMDEYARTDVLKQLHGFDNSQFVNFLTDKGFYVADQSQSNYPITFLSLTSSLNMAYLDELSHKLGTKTRNRRMAYQMIQANQVAKMLKQKGYLYIDLSNGWDYPANGNKHADIDVVTNSQKEYIRVFVYTTGLNPIVSTTILKPMLPQVLKNPSRNQHILTNFDYLAEIPDNPRSTFTFAHFMLPHGPYTFDEHGNEITNAPRLDENYYLDQLIFSNKKLTEAITAILEKSATPPIIILQSDTGPGLLNQFTDPFNELSQDQLFERISILNAYYLPDELRHKLYSSITPVNSFRLLLDLPLLEDNIYFANYQYPYKFIPIINETTD